MLSRTGSILRVALIYALLGLVASVAVAWGLAWGINVESRVADHAATADDFGDLVEKPAVRGQRRSFGSYRRSLEFKPAGADESWRPIVIRPLPGVQWVPGSFYIAPFIREVQPDQHRLPQWTYAIPHNGAWGRAYSFHEEIPESVFVMEDARGFPVLCMWNEWEQQADGSLIPVGGLQLPASNGNPFLGWPDPVGGRVLPLRPIWSGLAANTAFYGLLFWLAVRTFVGLRGWKRFKNGLCPACAYDLRFDYSRGCSECGRGSAGKCGEVR